MANAVPTIVNIGEMSVRATWVLTDASPTGDAVSLPDYTDMTVSVRGTFGAGTVVMQGADENVDASFWGLTDPQGTAISKTAGPAGETIEEAPEWLRPKITGNTGATVTVVLKGTRGWRR